MPDGTLISRTKRYKGSGHVPYLRQRRGRYYVQVAVPKPLQWRFGKTIETYLGTSEKSVARQKAPAAVAGIFAKFERDGGPIRLDELKSQAENELRRAYDTLAANFLDSHGKLPDLAREVAEDAADLIGASWQTNRLIGKPTTEYAEEVLDRIGAEKS